MLIIATAMEALLEAFGEPLFYILLFTCFVLCVDIKQKLGKAALNVVFISFSVGIVLLGASRLFLNLSDWGIYEMSDTSIHLWWHGIFYLSMLAFIWGGKRIKEISTSENPTGFSPKDTKVLSVLVISGVAIFLLAPLAKTFIGDFGEESIIDTLGVHHFIALILGIITAYYMLLMKRNWGKLLNVSGIPTVVFLGCMGIQHLWELLTESWKVLRVPEELIEQTELVILLIGVSSLATGLLRVRRVINKPSPV